MAVGLPDKEAYQRESCRYSTWASNIQGELWFGGRRTPVRIFDQSAGGFAVIAAVRPNFTRGDVVELRLDCEVFETRVTHVAEETAADFEEPGVRYRIGLERITEFFSPGEADSPRRSWLAALLGWTGAGSRPTNLAAGFVLAAVVVATPLVFAMAFQHFAGEPAGEPSDESPDRPQRAASPSRGKTGPAASNLPSSSPERKSGWGSLARLPGASVFLVPSVAQDLELSDAQQTQIRGIVEKTEEAFKRLDVRLQRMSRQGQSRNRENLLQAARQEALDALSSDQRRQFEARTAPQL